MGAYRLSFDADPEKFGPWSGRESAQVKFVQSLSDYLTTRCGASNLRILKLEEEASPAVSVPITKAGRGRK